VQSRRWVSLTLVMVTALPWSLSLGVMGLWLIAEPHTGTLARPGIGGSAGVAALCGAQIVFLMCIADRVFPRAHRLISRTLEGILAMIFLGSAGVLAGAWAIEWWA